MREGYISSPRREGFLFRHREALQNAIKGAALTIAILAVFSFLGVVKADEAPPQKVYAPCYTADGLENYLREQHGVTTISRSGGVTVNPNLVIQIALSDEFFTIYYADFENSTWCIVADGFKWIDLAPLILGVDG